MYRSWLGSSSDLVRIFAAKIREMSEEGPEESPQKQRVFLEQEMEKIRISFP
ncbi:hypothetical protein [Sphingobacterium cellulitidis]|uniref:hypothetical protein n=1 Tax=Sphingobacterium cellulitidis TaxID=1768011 RepID=UPI0015C68C38|nr:hypothetical protein [Sphingobacterium cellulitidis]